MHGVVGWGTPVQVVRAQAVRVLNPAPCMASKVVPFIPSEQEACGRLAVILWWCPVVVPTQNSVHSMPGPVVPRAPPKQGPHLRRPDPAQGGGALTLELVDHSSDQGFALRAGAGGDAQLEPPPPLPVRPVGSLQPVGLLVHPTLVVPARLEGQQAPAPRVECQECMPGAPVLWRHQPVGHRAQPGIPGFIRPHDVRPGALEGEVLRRLRLQQDQAEEQAGVQGQHRAGGSLEGVPGGGGGWGLGCAGCLAGPGHGPAGAGVSACLAA